MHFSPTPPPRHAQPIPGQPGLFRLGGTVYYQPHLHRVVGELLVPRERPRRESLDARRTAMSGLGDFSVPAPLPPPPYTWGVPTGRPWVLGAVPSSLRDQARANSMQLEALKRAADPLIAGTPWNVSTYIELVRRVVASPRSAIFELSRADFAIVVRGVLSNASQSQILAEGLLANPAATPSQVERARNLLFTAKSMMNALDNVVASVNTAQGALSSLGGWPLVVGAVVIVIAGVLLYTLFSSMQVNVTAIAEAVEACNLDEAAGRPCSGAQYQEYLRRAQEEQRRLGATPNLNDLFRQAGSLLFWGGLLAIGAGLAYIAWTAEPARRNVQERLRTASFAGIGAWRPNDYSTMDEAVEAAVDAAKKAGRDPKAAAKRAEARWQAWSTRWEPGSRYRGKDWGDLNGIGSRKLVTVDDQPVGYFPETEAEEIAKELRRYRDSLGSKARIGTSWKLTGSGRVRTLSAPEVDSLIRRTA